MDIDRALITKVVRDAGMAEALDSNILPELFSDNFTQVWRWCVQFFQEYASTPGTQALAHSFPDFQIDPNPTESIPVYADMLRRRFAHNTQIETMRKCLAALNAGEDPLQTAGMLRDAFIKVEELAAREQDVDWADSALQRIEAYDRAKDRGGIDGRPTPFPTLNTFTGGVHEGELWLIIARSGVGKSWCETLMGHYDWLNGGSPLLFSKEMMALQFASRLDAVQFKLPYHQFRRGLLDYAVEQRWKEGVRKLADKENKFRIIGEPGGGVSLVAAKIQRYKPSSVFIDGMYLMEDDRESDAGWERITNIARDLKRLAKTQRVGIVATVQFNRGGKTADDIAYGDIGKECDVMLGLYQNEDQRLSNLMEFKLLKNREGPLVELVVRWDLQGMVFGELDEINTESSGLQDDTVTRF